MRIVRFYENLDRGYNGRTIMKRGLTLEQAKAHCNDPETSSYTAQPPLGCGGDEEKIAKWHEEKKHWFDGFEYESDTERRAA